MCAPAAAFEIRHGVALAQVTIFGCALAGFLMTARRRRADGRPLIYWDLILVRGSAGLTFAMQFAVQMHMHQLYSGQMRSVVQAWERIAPVLYLLPQCSIAPVSSPAIGMRRCLSLPQYWAPSLAATYTR